MVDDIHRKMLDEGVKQAEEEMADVLEDKPQPLKTKVRKGFDKRGHIVHAAETTLQEVKEEHLYVVYRSWNREVVIEVDLLGDQLAVKSDGKLPPVIHIECPIPSCREANADKRSPLSITYENKPFEIEDLPVKDWSAVMTPEGPPVMGSDGKPAIMTRRLTIKDSFECSYCRRRFRITDNIMSDA